MFCITTILYLQSVVISSSILIYYYKNSSFMRIKERYTSFVPLVEISCLNFFSSSEKESTENNLSLLLNTSAYQILSSVDICDFLNCNCMGIGDLNPCTNQPVGKRIRGHPKKRWKEQFLEES
jgi:hypothetical protein